MVTDSDEVRARGHTSAYYNSTMTKVHEKIKADFGFDSDGATLRKVYELAEQKLHENESELHEAGRMDPAQASMSRSELEKFVGDMDTKELEQYLVDNLGSKKNLNKVMKRYGSYHKPNAKEDMATLILSEDATTDEMLEISAKWVHLEVAVKEAIRRKKNLGGLKPESIHVNDSLSEDTKTSLFGWINEKRRGDRYRYGRRSNKPDITIIPRGKVNEL